MCDVTGRAETPGIRSPQTREKFTLENVYNRHRKSYEGRPSWMWEDEGKYYAVADYHSSSGEFSAADIEFAKKAGLEDEVADVLAESEA